MEINMKNVSAKNENLIFEGLICAIDIHRQAMKLSENMINKFENTMLSLIVFGIISLNLNLLRIGLSQNNIKEFVFPFFFVTVCILYMFLGNYSRQNIIDHNNDIFVVAYSVQWYAAPLYIQKMIFFLLQRSAKNFFLNLGKLFVVSLECFATLIRLQYLILLLYIQRDKERRKLNQKV
ncbi:uncharacterized protein LOC105426736 isoform X3 [Pogonomyrmex barbatus]|nr:uncharacterized protein LOC105426736 isoform X3 [Pogonomyrmex barbatus]